MKGSIDLFQKLHDDLHVKIFSYLDDAADFVRFGTISHFWREFVVEKGYCKSLCLKLYPETSIATKAIEKSDVIESFGFDTSDCVEVEKLKKNHRIYAFLARGLAPSLTKHCIQEAICASSTGWGRDHIHHTLIPEGEVNRRPSYWLSIGDTDRKVPETLTYKLVSKLCFITEIGIQPFQVYANEDFHAASAKAVRFRVGHVRDSQHESYLVGDSTAGRRSIEDHVVWTYTSKKFRMDQNSLLQKFKLPEPVLAIGGLLQIELLGRVAGVHEDIFHFCIAHVQVVGRPLTDGFSAELIDHSSKFVLNYTPEQ